MTPRRFLMTIYTGAYCLPAVCWNILKKSVGMMSIHCYWKLLNSKRLGIAGKRRKRHDQMVVMLALAQGGSLLSLMALQL
jgi:hypothetical protein